MHFSLPPFILTHLLAFSLTYLLLAFASPYAAPDPYPAVISLPSRDYSPQNALTRRAPAPDVDHDLLPFVLISTIDGALQAVDRDGGQVRWALRDGVEPLVGGGVSGKGAEEEYIVEPLSGALYIFDEQESGEAKVRKLPLTVEQL
jgi:serine/threonine-protein kinase/endoribonuclease IRE1